MIFFPLLFFLSRGRYFSVSIPKRIVPVFGKSFFLRYSDGTITSYVWNFISGPSDVNPSDTVSTTASSLVAGTYVFSLTVTDDDGATGADSVSITVNPAVVSTPACSDDIDNNDSEDTLVDELDPGCHTDGNPSNTGSYNPNDNDETDVPACFNTGDDDNDGLVDALDPGCHSDGNAGNPNSYVPTDNNETNAVLTQCSDGIDNDNDGKIDFSSTNGDPNCDSLSDNDENDTNTNTGGGGGGSSRRQCADKKDNDRDGLTDKADPGCHSDGNANNASSYVSRDNSELNEGGEVLGAQTSCGIYVDKYLRKGYNNNVETVKKVQIFLNNYMNAGLVVDGIYGSKTEMAVKNFQLARKEKVLNPWGISAPTGIFYLTTQTEVNNIMCPDLNLAIPTYLINFTPNAIK